MDKKEPKNSPQAQDDCLRPHPYRMGVIGKRESEGYAEHLARVLQDADYCRDLLQARYKALHDDQSKTDS